MPQQDHRKPWVGGNWKCNGTVASITTLCAALKKVDFDPEVVGTVNKWHHDISGSNRRATLLLCFRCHYLPSASIYDNNPPVTGQQVLYRVSKCV